MSSPRLPLRRLLAGAAACLLAAGCGDDIGTCYPVEGQVLLGGKPLRGMTGSVMFVPDKVKGNPGPLEAGGHLDAEGRYKLSTKGKPGAPAGWYKVVITAVPPGIGDRDPVRRPPIHARYVAEKTTPLSVQVVAEPAPGTYDVKVTRN
jgi:hypothetical protein